MTTTTIKSAPYHDISSILELEDKAVAVKVQKPKFENELLHPYRGSYYCLLLVTNGSVNHSSNLEHFKVEEDTLVFSSPGIINSWEAPSSQIDGYSLFFTAEFFRQHGNNTIYLNELPYFNWDAQHFLKVTKAESRSLSKLLKSIQDELDSPKSYSKLLIQSYITILLISLERLYIKKGGIQETRSKKGQLTYKYQCLVSHHIHQNLSVSDYADLLNVTPNYLNKTVKDSIGKTAGTLIQEMIILEAKALLYQTDINVSEVAYHLNFEDPSYFGRFFKKHTHMTPYEFRNLRKEKP